MREPRAPKRLPKRPRPPLPRKSSSTRRPSSRRAGRCTPSRRPLAKSSSMSAPRRSRTRARALREKSAGKKRASRLSFPLPAATSKPRLRNFPPKSRAASSKPRRVPALRREKLDDAKSFLFLCCEYSICVASRRSRRERRGGGRERGYRTRHRNLQVDQLCHRRRGDRLGLWEKASSGVSKESRSHQLGDRQCHQRQGRR